MVVILPAETLAALLPLLGPAAVAPHVRLIEAEAAARNPGALLATWQEFTDDLHHRARPGRAVAETFRHEAKQDLEDAQRRYMRHIQVNARPEYHIEQFDLVGG